jgi:2-keto-4-pentenoate hydratase/2-oxohepta-3-ene-1,7-dioic acid hydratase in catechol pathway
LEKNGSKVQQGNSSDMIFSIEKIIAFVSSYFTLQKGDLIYTGTPAGVSEVVIGDTLEGYLFDKKLLQCNIK